MIKTLYIALLVSSSLMGCSTLGSYSYSDSSNPKGPDKYNDQIMVSDAIDEPLNSVCQITTTRKNYKTLWFGDTEYTGSAALIDSRYLITAAHNVYDYPLNYLTSVKVSCGVKSVSENTVQVKLEENELQENISIPRYEFKIFNQGRKYEYDYAFIDLGKKVSAESSFNLPDKRMLRAGSIISIAGYPGGLISNLRTLYMGAGNINDIDGNLAAYSINTATGNSGGPIWVKGEDGRYYIVAVHVKNSGGRIVNESLLADWKEWLKSRR